MSSMMRTPNRRDGLGGPALVTIRGYFLHQPTCSAKKAQRKGINSEDLLDGHGWDTAPISPISPPISPVAVDGGIWLTCTQQAKLTEKDTMTYG